MSFALATAVAGAGTVSCAGTTTVTGSGTNFGAFAGTARLGGTITVGGVTKTITAIASTTSLTTDTAFGTFTAQAYTGQREILQTGTDTMNTSLGAAAGFTITNRGDQLRTFDANGLDVTISGVLTVDSTIAQLRNNTTTSGLKVLSTGSASAELIINGRRAAANNGPFPYAGLDWLGANGQQVMQLQGTATYPAKLTLRDSCIRYGADWFTTNSGQFSTITTEGDTCWILNASGSGTTQARLRLNNTTASINFTAKKTYVGVWLNFGVPQTSLKGYTPIATDGPEINLSSVSVASRIVIEDYDTTYIQAAYYAGSKITLYGGAWVRLKNNLVGSNFQWQQAAPSNRNVIELSKQITATAKDSAGVVLNNGYMYYQPVGANVAGIRAKGGSTDITFDLTQQAVAFASGSASSEFVYSWAYANSGGLQALSIFSYFCTGTTKGAETHTVYSSRYGYDKQSATVSLIGNGAATPTYVHVSLPTTDKIIANAAAITGVAFNFSTKTITVTGTLTIQQIYDAYQYQLNQTANLQQPDECTVASGQTYYVGWTINNSGTINEGTSLTTIRAATITNTGNIFAIYTDSAGTSTIWKFENITVGSSIIIYDGSGVTKYFQQEVTSAGDYSYYIPPGTAGTYSWAIELYGKQRQSGSFAANTGGLLFYEPIYVEDVGISETVKATVAAYTAIDNLDKFYDFTAYRRLSEDFIKLGQIATRSGTSVEIGNRNLTVNASAAAMESIVSLTITIKSGALAAGTKYSTIIATPPRLVTAATTEVITAAIEDGAGDSSVTIQGGSGDFTLWKLANATPDDDYATGTNLGNVGNVTYRFLSASGYKIIIRDNTTAYRINCPMDKGIYIRGLFFGDQVQLAQSAEVTQINTKVDILTNNVAAVPAAILASTVETGATVVQSLRLHNSVLGGVVSGGGSGVETFRDLANTKDRLVSTNTATGDRTAEVYDLT